MRDTRSRLRHVVECEALKPHQEAQGLVAEPAALPGQAAQAYPHSCIVTTCRGVAVRLRLKADPPAGTTLRTAFLFAGPAHCRSPCARRQKFFLEPHAA